LLSFTALSPPPSQLTVYADGWAVGTVFKIDEPGEAEILDHTLMSVPYRLLDRPRVLLLGEVGGPNVWLAERWNADSVTVVNGNPQLVSLVSVDLAELSGGVFTREGIEVIVADPRLFLEAARQVNYDLIQLVSAEGMSVGGLLAIHEDYLLTREGLAIALRRLRPGGLLAVTRQQQDPPRDNVKLLLTLAESLESLGFSDPGAHVVQLRNYLAVITLASFDAFSDSSPPSSTRGSPGRLVNWAPTTTTLRGKPSRRAGRNWSAIGSMTSGPRPMTGPTSTTSSAGDRSPPYGRPSVTSGSGSSSSDT
jgi:hypothetical protein